MFPTETPRRGDATRSEQLCLVLGTLEGRMPCVVTMHHDQQAGQGIKGKGM